MDNLYGIYAGIVENNRDSEKLGRLKVRVPHVFGIVGSAVGAIPVNDLPWALPMGLPAGGSSASGGCSWLPEPGDQVMVQFLDGEPEKPVWSWSMQTLHQAETLKLHQYETGPSGSVGKPKRAAWMRYGHTIEWNTDGLILTTAHGYRMLLTDSDAREGQVLLSSAAGQYLSFDDDTSSVTLNVLDDFYALIGQELNITCADMRLDVTTGSVKATIGEDVTLDTGRDFDVTALGSASLTAVDDIVIETSAAVNLTSKADTTLKFTSLFLGLEADEPFVLGLQLTTFLESLLTWLSTHTHITATEGSPTSPPIVPPVGVVQPNVTALISTAIFGS